MTKKKFRFNAVDAFIILVVLAAVAVFAYVFLSEKGGTEDEPAENVKLQYVMQTVELRDRYTGAVSVGDELYDSEAGKFLGTVTDVSTAPVYSTGTDAKTGAQVVSEVEGRKCLYITLEADAEIVKDTYYVDGISAIVGGAVKFITPNLIAGANIVSVEVIG